MAKLSQENEDVKAVSCSSHLANITVMNDYHVISFPKVAHVCDEVVVTVTNAIVFTRPESSAK